MLNPGDTPGHRKRTRITYGDWNTPSSPRAVGDRSGRGSIVAFKHLDLRLTRDSGPQRSQSVGKLLASSAPPLDANAIGDDGGPIGATGINLIFEDCTLEADHPVALNDASLILVDTDVRGLGHHTWTEIRVTTNELGNTRSALIATFGGPLIVSATAEHYSAEQEEEAAAHKIARALNSKGGTHYRG